MSPAARRASGRRRAAAIPATPWAGRGGARFHALSLSVPPEGEEPAVAALWEAGCLGVESVSSARRRSAPRLTLRAYFPGRAARRPLADRIARSLRRAAIAGAGAPRLTTIRDRRWAEVWQRSLRPMAIGRRVLVVPEGCRVPARRGRVPILVRFGQAFGTGEHASTRFCLRLLESHLRPGDRALDLGTGTGILAMAACRLGASEAIGVDDDPVALAVARSNLRDNRLRGRVLLRRADAEAACRSGRYDIALVNIGASAIGRILPGLAAALRSGGRAILAGLLVEDEPEILGRAAAAGFVFVERRRARPWSALVLRRA